MNCLPQYPRSRRGCLLYGFESGRTQPMISVLVPEDLFLSLFWSPKVAESFGDAFWCHFFASYTTSASESELNVDIPLPKRWWHFIRKMFIDVIYLKILRWMLLIFLGENELSLAALLGQPSTSFSESAQREEASRLLHWGRLSRWRRVVEEWGCCLWLPCLAILTCLSLEIIDPAVDMSGKPTQIPRPRRQASEPRCRAWRS